MATMDFLKDEKVSIILITYNGASFDIPFMKQSDLQRKSPLCLNMYEFDLILHKIEYWP